MQETSMQIAAQEDENDTDWVENAYANNEYIKHEVSHPDKSQGDG